MATGGSVWMMIVGAGALLSVASPVAAEEAQQRPAIEALAEDIRERHQLLSDVELGYTEERYYNKRAFENERGNALRRFRWLARGAWCRAETQWVAHEGETPVDDDHQIVISDGSTFLKYTPDQALVMIQEPDARIDTGEGRAGEVAAAAGLFIPGRLGEWLGELRTSYTPPQQDRVDGAEAWRLTRRQGDFIDAMWIARADGNLAIHSEGRQALKTGDYVLKGWVRTVTATEQLPNGGIVPKEKKMVWYLEDSEGKRTWTWLFRYRLIYAGAGERQVQAGPMSLDWLPMGTTIRHPMWTEVVGGEVDKELIKAVRDGVAPSDEEVWDGVEVRLGETVVP
jgi:hypothetical protein